MRNLRFRRSSAASVAALVLFAMAVPLVGLATANHPTGTCLDVEPDAETDQPVGSLHRLTATLRSTATSQTNGPVVSCEGTGQGRPTSNNTNTGTSPLNIDFEITGPNDPDDANSPATPDLTCAILPGSSSCTVEYQGLVVGEDEIRAWIDHDGRDAQNGGATEADLAEEQNSTTGPGTGCPAPMGPGDQQSPPEPDCTDVATVEWEAGTPSALDCDDQNGPDTERETNPSLAGGNSNETYTCTVTDKDGNVVASDSDSDLNLTVFGEVENSVNDPDGPPQNTRPEGASYDSPDYRCNTDDTGTGTDGEDDGTCTITVGQVDGEEGTAEICFWIEEQTSGDFLFASSETPNEGGDAEQCGGESTGEAQQPNGSDTGNDLADQVEKTWEARRASSVDAEPETDTNQPNENHTITAFVYDQFGGQFSGSNTVHFEFFQGSPSDGDGNTPASPDKSCTTQGSNQCSITYTSQKVGLDRICVFVGSAPSMQGDNNTGTCDGESLTDADDEAGTGDPPEGNDDQDVVQKRWGTTGSAGTATRLDCDPETDSNPTGTGHTVTCTARDDQNNIVTGENIDAEATGANDPDNGDSPQTPDFTCTTNTSGQCTFTHGTGGTGTTSSTGETQYRAWIDSDNNNVTTAERDATEGQAETTQPGGTAEPDNTDVVTKTWTGNGRRIDCEPETATNQAGTSHVVTCTVTDVQNRPVQGESVTFTETGPGTVSPTTATTDANGRATTTATSSEAGEQTITGTITNDTTGSEPGEVDECDKAANDPSGAPAGECSDSVTKTWTPPPSPQCSDGADNDGDGKADHPADPGCSSANDPDETDETQCADSIDNDGDGKTDHPGDPGCESPQDNDEADPQPTVESGPCAGYQHNSTQPRPDGNGNIVVGSNGPDNLVGTEGDDVICGLGGNDSLRGLGGDDDLYGGNNEDNIRGTAGNDAMFGGGGLDVMRGGSGNDLARGGAHDDTIRGFTGKDRLIGGGGNDVIRAGGGRDTLIGNAGDDILGGGSGSDRCRGGRGKDILSSCER